MVGTNLPDSPRTNKNLNMFKNLGCKLTVCLIRTDKGPSTDQTGGATANRHAVYRPQGTFVQHKLSYNVSFLCYVKNDIKYTCKKRL